MNKKFIDKSLNGGIDLSRSNVKNIVSGWLVPILLLIVAYFLKQTNDQILLVSQNQIELSLNVALLQHEQKTSEEDIEDLEERIIQLNLIIDKLEQNRSKYLKTYNYLHTDKARKKLE